MFSKLDTRLDSSVSEITWNDLMSPETQMVMTQQSTMGTAY